MLIVHHLQRSQSERIVWLCEELEIPYELKIYKRDSRAFTAPPELQALHPTQAAPIIQDGDITLAESGAIVEYILVIYRKGKLTIPPTAPNYADYLYFLHFGNGYLQPAVRNQLAASRALVANPADISAKFGLRNFRQALDILEKRVGGNEWLAGDEFTAADIMNVFSLTTMRLFSPFSLEEHPGVVSYLKRISKRDSYKRAFAKGDPGFSPLITAEKPDHVVIRGLDR